VMGEDDDQDIGEDMGEEIEDSDFGMITSKGGGGGGGGVIKQYGNNGGRPVSAKPARPQSAVPHRAPSPTGGRPFAGDSAENRSSQRRVQSAHAHGGAAPPTVAQPVMDIGGAVQVENPVVTP
jgi:hypothetical protein